VVHVLFALALYLVDVVGEGVPEVAVGPLPVLPATPPKGADEALVFSAGMEPWFSRFSSKR